MKHIFENSQHGVKRVLLHILFWLSYISFFIIQYEIISKNFDIKTGSLSLGLFALIDIAASYFTVYVLLEKFLMNKKFFWFIVLLPLSIAFFIIAQRAMGYFITLPLFHPDSPSRNLSFWDFNPFFKLINIYSVVVLFAAIKLIKFWFMDQKQKAELESKNKISEMAMLRSQLNPHFLFNTLNNIDTLVFTNQQKASDAIIKLSDILRSVIYESDEMVPLNKEIEYLKNYIDLQSLRLKNKNFVQFNYENTCFSKKIAPMILIPFVENAFKHGFKNTSSPGIIIDLACNKNTIIFKIVNKNNKHMEINKDTTPGVGLKNTKRRLELIYGNNFQLQLLDGDEEYLVKLELKNQ